MTAPVLGFNAAAAAAAAAAAVAEVPGTVTVTTAGLAAWPDLSFAAAAPLEPRGALRQPAPPSSSAEPEKRPLVKVLVAEGLAAKAAALLGLP